MIKKILIAEDNEDGRVFLRTVLENENFSVFESENGRQALKIFEAESLDLIITDIRMPELDGLSLLRTVRATQPDLPVIIISAYRDIENIVDALRDGACDYITKPYECEQVLKSIRRADRLIRDEIEFRRCLEYMTDERKVFEFESDPKLINMMAKSLCRNIAILELREETQSMQISLIEALTNAIYHGNLGMSSDLKKGDTPESFKAYEAEAQRRLKRAPYCFRKVYVEYILSQDQVKFVVRDQGLGFDHKAQPDPYNLDSFISPSGRGVLMIQTFCDSVSWNEKGNEITLVKFRKGNPKSQKKIC